MTVSVDIQLPGVSGPAYAGMIARLGPLLARAPGFLSHSAAPTADGYHVVEQWRSVAECTRFMEEHVAPAASAAGIRPEVKIEELDRLLTPPHFGAPREGASREEVATPVQSRWLAKDEGPTFRVGPLSILVKEDGSLSRQTFAVAEFRGQGFRVPPHKHHEHDETIYVVEGTMGVLLGDETFTAEQGASFTIPIGVTHSVWNESEAPVRFLNTIVPARYLDYFHELSQVTSAGKLGAPEDMRRVMVRYGLEPIQAAR